MAMSYVTSLTIIFVILGGLLLFGRKLRGHPWLNAKSSQSAINVSSARSVGAHNTLAIAEVEGRRFLIAIGRNGIAKIGCLDTRETTKLSAEELQNCDQF